MTRHVRLLACATIGALMPAIAAAQGGLTANKQGQGGSVVQGSAGPGGSQGDNGLQRCDKPMGAMAVVEPQNEILAALSAYKLQSPVGLIRMMIQQSNCFIVVERGVGMRNALQERQLNASGELRDNSNMGGGQMVTADFILTPSVVFSENNAGGVGVKAGTFREGDVLAPKIANIKLMSDASDGSKALATLTKADELVVIGGEKDGFVNVQGATAAGWVKIVLVTKR
jgi:hypothetical protein